MDKSEGTQKSTIKLIILNGPLSGQSFDFMPGSKVHIGRIVRGNAVTIKDADVSSKHLLIEFQLQTGCWMVSDLDSSNGTFLNGRLLDPFNPAEVSHGDVIKIGESTSISVEIGVMEECMMQKNPPMRRGRPLAGKEKKKIDELQENCSKMDGTMDKSSQAEAKGEEKASSISVKQEMISWVWENSGESGVEAVEKVVEINEAPKRVTRGSRKKAVDVGDLKKQQEVVIQQRTTRSMKEGKVLESLEKNPPQANKKTRKGTKEKQNLETLVENVQLEKEDVMLDLDTKMDETKDYKPMNEVADIPEVEKVVEIIEAPKRVTRGSRKKAVDVGDLKKQQEVVIQQRTTRSMKEGKVLESLEKNPPQANKKTRKGKKEKQNLETLVENVQLEKEDVLLDLDTKMDETKDYKPMNEVTDIPEEGAPFVAQKKANSIVEGSSNVASSSGSKHQNDVTLDLENMTIGQLFDHWEVTIPKQIIDATEIMISDMIEKSKMFHEFRRLQKNE